MPAGGGCSCACARTFRSPHECASILNQHTGSPTGCARLILYEKRLNNYQNVQQDILETFIDRGQLRQLAEPTILPGGKRIPSLKLHHPRQLALMHALVRFAHVAARLDVLYGGTLPGGARHPRLFQRRLPSLLAAV